MSQALCSGIQHTFCLCDLVRGKYRFQLYGVETEALKSCDLPEVIQPESGRARLGTRTAKLQNPYTCYHLRSPPAEEDRLGSTHRPSDLQGKGAELGEQAGSPGWVPSSPQGGVAARSVEAEGRKESVGGL